MSDVLIGRLMNVPYCGVRLMNENQRWLDQYELQQCLRKDARSEVWKAFDSQQQRTVTIALLHFTLPLDKAFPRFSAETCNFINLRHPSLVPILDVKVLGETSSPFSNCAEAYVVMDFIDGLSLAFYLQMLDKARKILAPTEILQILAPIGEAIDYLHQQRIIHGLIKPSSILLSQQNAPFSPKLMDLGMHNTYDPQRLSPDDACYIAPEIIKGDRNNIRSDIYSLGVILYEMCTTAPPFQGQTTAEVIKQQLHDLPPSPVLANPLVSPELAAVIMRALAKDPMTRFPSASALMYMLAKAFKISQPTTAETLSDSAHCHTVLSGPKQAQSFSGPMPALTDPHTSAPFLPAIAAYSGKYPVPSLLDSSPHLASGAQRALATTSPAAMTPLPMEEPLPAKRKRSNVFIAFTFLILFLLIAASIGTWYFFYPPGGKAIVGHAFFVSSGLMSVSSSNGITDSLQIELDHINPPQPGKMYDAWLLPDYGNESNALPLLIGELDVKNGQAMLNYAGDANHTDLLSLYSRFLITEEDANSQPVNPSLNAENMRYAAAFSNTPNPEDTVNHFSLLAHMRHLLAQDPKLAKVGLVGGLDNWLYRNTLKILEWAGSARDLALTKDNPALLQRQLVRILDYLDGSQFVQTENLPQDIPPILVDPTIARVALLQTTPEQQPPGYLKHIGTHLSEITQSPGISPDQQQLASEINEDINHVQTWLQNVHKDAAELVRMPIDQLEQPATSSIFNDLFVQANMAFTGQTDPHTGQVKDGVAQIHYKIQRLATFDIAVCSGNDCM